MSGGSGPHDAVFRRVLGEPANAASQLRAVLPAGVVGRLDLGRLTRVPGSFVDASLRWRHSDLLFTAPLAGHEAFVYVLVEHQSGADPLMPFRMLRYVVRIWDQYLVEHPAAVRLPAVVPLVVHHNRRPWNGPTDVWDVVDLDQGAADVLRARPLTPPVRMALLLLKIAKGNPRLVDHLRQWADDLRAVLDRPGGHGGFRRLVDVHSERG